MKLNHFQKKMVIIKLIRNCFIHLLPLKNETIYASYHPYLFRQFKCLEIRYRHIHNDNNNPLSGLYTSILPHGRSAVNNYKEFIHLKN